MRKEGGGTDIETQREKETERERKTEPEREKDSARAYVNVRVHACMCKRLHTHNVTQRNVRDIVAESANHDPLATHGAVRMAVCCLRQLN